MDKNCYQRLLLAVTVLLGAAVAVAAPVAAQTFTDFPIPTPNSLPSGITTGPDGALWFTESGANKIGRITTAGLVTEFPIPTANSEPSGITAGPDGALWFTESNGSNVNNIGRITTAGMITGFPLPPSLSPNGITSGPDGALWFTANTSTGINSIGRITTAGMITEFPLPAANSYVSAITTGPDGALWFIEQSANKIGRITTAGVVTEFPIPTARSEPAGITAGPDGALWFTEPSQCECNAKIGRITTAGVFTEFPVADFGDLPGQDSLPLGITLGPDGALWFTAGFYSEIGRITTAGVFGAFGPTDSGLNNITTGPNGALWFTESGANKIGRLQPPTFIASATSGSAPLPVTFTASGLALPMTYTINFGDGTAGALQGSCIGVAAIVGGQGGIQCSGFASHVYTAAGSYTATLLNALGLTVGTVTISVTGAAPNVSIAPPNKATTLGSQTNLGSQTIPAMQDAMQDVPRQTLEVPFAGSNATVPTISSFSASPASISPFAEGGSATLSWSVASATSLSISGLGAVIGNSIQVSPSQTTTYTLTASNAQGAATAQATVTVAGYRSRQADPLSR
jgi:virginiamycin B lyase